MKERKQKTWAKRLLVAMLSVMMAVTFIPTSLFAFAAEPEATPDDVQNNVQTEAVQNDEPQTQATEATKEDTTKDEKASDKEAKADAAFAEGQLKEESDLYKVTVSYDADAKIPAGAKLAITEFSEKDKEYKKAKDALLADKDGNSAFSQATKEEQKDLGMAAFDLTIYDKDGKAIEPKSKVSVSVEFKELPDGVDADALAASMEIQHLNESTGDVVVEKVATVNGREASKDKDLGEIDVKEKKETAETEFNVDVFSTFTITWRSGGSNRTTTIHYGYMQNGRFVEFDSDPTYAVTNTNYPDYLIRDFDGYEYAGETYYRTNQSNTPANGGTRIQAMLRYNNNNNQWRYHGYSTTYSTNNWQEIANNSHIYVVYEAKPDITTGGTAVAHITDDTVHPKEPDVLKESKDNNDGTRELALSITGHTAKLEAEKLADVIVVFDNSGSMARDMAGNTTNVDANRRLTIAKNAVNSLADTLLRKTNSTGGKLIRMSLISFNTTATISQGLTDNYGTFSTAVNRLTANGGTNWEQALQLANQMAVDSERTTFVVFVSDGDPTFRVSRMDANDSDLASNTAADINNEYYIEDNVYGTGSSDIRSRNYNSALAEAKSIVQHNKKLYTIGISNDVSNMAKLNNEAGGSGNYTATSASDLENAFNDIISQIEGTLGYGANVNDGITGLTNLTAKAPIVGVDESSFKYFKNGSPWDPTDEGASEAHYNSETGAVEWDLGTDFQLEDNVTYKVTFTVWPSQQAIDYVTQLNNKEITFDELPADVQEQISESPAGSGNFVLETNTKDANVSYQESTKVGNTVTVIGEPKSKPFQKVDPLKLDTMPFSVKKIWTDILTGGEDRDPSVTLYLQRRVVNGDGTFGQWENFEVPYIKPDGSTAHSNQILLSDGNDWKARFYISPGLETVHNGETVVYNPGYEFRVTEPNQDYHYELNGEIIKPMLVNFEETYIGDVDGNESLTAENIVKSGIDVKKTLLDKNGNEIKPDVEFTIRGKILDPDESPYTFDMSWDDRSDKSTGEGASAIWQQHQNDPIAFHKYDKNGNRIGYKLHVASTDNIEITLKPGEYVRFINVPQDCTFEFEEDSKDGFELDDIDATIKKGNPLVPDTENPAPTVANGKASLTTGVVGDRQYSVGFTNKVTEPTKATVTKEFKGITAAQLTDAFKEGYSITANYNGTDHTLTLNDRQGLSVSEDGLTYTWTLDNLVIGDKVVVSESGYDKKGEEESATDVIPGFEFQSEGSTIGATINSLAALNGGTIPDANKAKLVNDYKAMTTNIFVQKIWKSAFEGITAVIIELKADGKTVGQVRLNAGNNWMSSFTQLPIYDADTGEPIVYTIAEVAVMAAQGDGEVDIKDLFEVVYGKEKDKDGNTVLTAENTKSVTSVEVTKIWNDSNDQDGKRANVNATVQLYERVGTEGQEQTVGNAVNVGTANNWTYTWDNLPVKKGGVQVYYTVKETLPATSGYTTNYTAEYKQAVKDGKVEFSITNSYEPAKTTVKVTKKWEDANDQDGLRPESISMQLFADGKEKGEPVTLDEDSSWTYTWRNLDVNAGGKAIEYTVDETAVPEGYTKTVGKVTGNAESGFEVEITNKLNIEYVAEGTSFDIIKKDQDGKPMSGVEFVLSNGLSGELKDEIKESTNSDGKATIKIDVDEDGKWLGTDERVKGSYEYTLTETPVTGYDAAGPWKVTIVPKKNADGTIPTYTIKDIETPDGGTKSVWQRFISWITGDIAGPNAEFDGEKLILNVTNTASPEEVTVTKTFDGIKLADAPENFAINVTYTDVKKGASELALTTGMASTDNVTVTTSGNTVTWKISNVRYGTDFKAEEVGYTKTGYKVTPTVTATGSATDPVIVVSDSEVSGEISVPANNNAVVAFTNKYEFVEVIIKKSLPTFVNHEGKTSVNGTETNAGASFAYHVMGYDAVEGGTLILDTTTGIDLSNPGNGEALLGKISPNVKRIVVTEVYAGNYTPKQQTVITTTLHDDTTTDADGNKTYRKYFEVSFENTWSDDITYKTGVTNKFKNPINGTQTNSDSSGETQGGNGSN